MLEIGLSLLFLFLLIYFLPTMITFSKNGKDKFVILAINLFLGWTIFGWLFSLVLACTDMPAPKSPKE
ncbi:hypothetical protein E308F_17180 [Moorella sp. E308F]|uniref:superinfection immunity protein n=1 Tax=unclassified Neomoorella TaxID=2676739 RepID=UPI0010FFB797|nr:MULTISPECIES: superinfection immunity protein [unclassified Moorella (in: firmicutes)]GEA15474.1 hypothetical protein E308F_17180 [Moorella sp. E308F]GEA19668.1 hypothetical protein E306M_28060 [Moorella sp. E306M]